MNENPKEAARRLSGFMLEKGFQPIALHAYTDEQGKPIFWRIRMKHADTGEKWIRPLKTNGHGFQLSEPIFTDGKPLYRLHDLAQNQELPVWYVEGEICADTLEMFGVLATTGGGASSDDKTNFSPLKGRTVTIWPDNDRAGIEHSERVALKLRDIGCDVETIDVRALGLPEKGDCVDWLAAHAESTVADLSLLPRVNQKTGLARGEHQLKNGFGTGGEFTRTVELIRGSDVKPEPVSWLWGGWLASGKMHVLGGAPGTGKTTISMSLASTVTMGGRWPDGTLSPIGNVVIWSGEDDPADTLVPRLAVSGADLSRIYFVADVFDGKERRSFDPARDMEALQRKLVEVGEVRLLIVDPIVSAVAGDSHKNAEVRRGLQPLADLAASMRCALLGITHFSKGTGGRDPVERLTGSLAFGALARVVLVAAKYQEEGEDGRMVRLFVRAKSNIGPDDGGFEYDLNQAEMKAHPEIFSSSVLWGEAVEGAARELLATADATGEDGEGGTLADAKRFLSEILAEGPLQTKAIKADADGAGYSWATIRRAQKALGITPRKLGGYFGSGKAHWVWTLPTTEGAQTEHLQGETRKALKKSEDAQQKVVSIFKNSEHLQGNSGTVEEEV